MNMDEVDAHVGERGNRGLKISRGYRSVDAIEVHYLNQQE
jgi:hypothetical protein